MTLVVTLTEMPLGFLSRMVGFLVCILCGENNVIAPFYPLDFRKRSSSVYQFKQPLKKNLHILSLFCGMFIQLCSSELNMKTFSVTKNTFFFPFEDC